VSAGNTLRVQMRINCPAYFPRVPLLSLPTRRTRAEKQGNGGNGGGFKSRIIGVWRAMSALGSLSDRSERVPDLSSSLSLFLYKRG